MAGEQGGTGTERPGIMEHAPLHARRRTRVRQVSTVFRLCRFVMRLDDRSWGWGETRCGAGVSSPVGVCGITQKG
jgi:hypothetical protein